MTAEAAGTAEPSRPRPAQARGVLGGGAWALGRISGIEIAVDHSWLLIFALISVSLAGQFGQEHPTWSPVAAWSAAVLTSLVFFASIVLHELGHSLTAQRRGLRVQSITLFVFGGMARLESEPRRPRDEIAIAIAGPLVSLALAGVFGVLAEWLAGSAGLGGILAAMFAWLSRINWVLVLFNTVPGFPLDGGRVLRGFVWAWTGSFSRATQVAAGMGTAIAYGLIFLGIVSAVGLGQWLGGLWLAFIGWFLLSAARSSVGQLVTERLLSRVPVVDVMERPDDALASSGTSVAQLVDEVVFRRGRRTVYVVDPSGHLLGLATLRELASVPADARGSTRVDQVMVPTARLEVLRPGETAWTALQRMSDRGVNQLPVVAEGRLVGALTRERLLRLIEAGLALDQRQ